MARRLEGVLSKVVSWEQRAYVRGRSISDNILLASEAHHSVVAARTSPAMILKMDMEKAFDKISWRFLMQVLNKFGFP